MSDAFRVLSRRQDARWAPETRISGLGQQPAYDVLPWARREAPPAFALWQVASVPHPDDVGAEPDLAQVASAAAAEASATPETDEQVQANSKFAELVGDLDLELGEGVADPAPAPIIDEQALEAAKQQGYEQGHAAGLSEGLTQGQAQGQTMAETAWQAQQALLAELVAQVPRLSEQVNGWREPMRELALHIAELRGELRATGEVVARLVQGALDNLEQPSARVVATLHPDDAAQLSAMASELPKDMRIQPDPSLTRGSVRVSTDDSLIEDLMSTRLEALAAQLLSGERPWASRSALLQEQEAATPLAQRAQDIADDDITDATTRDPDEA
ncbi:MAG: FliH/SctL family protein [Burkholderiaceae bacterium]